MEVSDILQETGIKTISMEKKCKKAKWLSEEALQRAVKRRKVKSKGEKERYTPIWMQSSKARRDKKAFLSDQCKEIEENNRMGKTRDPLHSQPENLLNIWPVLTVFIGLILGTEKSRDRRTPTGLGNSSWGPADSAFGTYQRVASPESLNCAHCCLPVRRGFKETRKERL